MPSSLTIIPKKYVGKLTYTGVVTGTISVGQTLTGATSLAAGKVLSHNLVSKIIELNNLTGIFAAAETSSNGAGGSVVVAANGFDTSFVSSSTFGSSEKGLVRTTRIGSRVQEEVIDAYKLSNTRRIDLRVLPVFTATASFSGADNLMVTGETLIVTLAVSEPVTVTGLPTLALTLGAGARTMTYNGALSTSTSLRFNYTVAVGDVAIAGGVVVAAAVTLGTGVTVADQAVGNALLPTAVSFTSPATNLYTVN